MGSPPSNPSDPGPQKGPKGSSNDSLTQEVGPPRDGRQGRWKGRLLGLAALVALGVTGAYAWTTYQDLRALRSEKRDLQDALELHRTNANELDTKLSSCEEDLSEKEVVQMQSDHHATQLQIALDTCQSSLDDLEDQQAQTRERLEQFESLTSKFQNMIDTGKLDVVYRRGQMIVRLPAAILFPSGSADISESGKEALEEVANILSEMPRRRFTVAGHTDNVPVGSAPFESNWELSTERALAVTTVLIEKGMRADSLIAAGYGEHAPIAPNRSKRARRKNRRIEIILQPDLRPVLRQKHRLGD